MGVEAGWEHFRSKQFNCETRQPAEARRSIPTANFSCLALRKAGAYARRSFQLVRAAPAKARNRVSAGASACERALPVAARSPTLRPQCPPRPMSPPGGAGAPKAKPAAAESVRADPTDIWE